jgi:hypothetical protein
MFNWKAMWEVLDFFFAATTDTSCVQFEEALPYIAGTDPEWEPKYTKIRSYKHLFASPSDLDPPFGSICSFSQDGDKILQSLPPRHIVDALVQSYFEAFEPIYRLFHPRQFDDELDAFWIDNSNCSEEWLGQVFMVLALGYQTAPAHILTSIEQLDWTERFHDAAQFFLKRSTCFSAPTLSSVQTMCLVVVAQMLGIVKEAVMSQLVAFVGFLTRSALEVLTPFETEIRKRIFTTVRLLELDVALRTGTSSIYEDQAMVILFGINDTDIDRTEHRWTSARQQSPSQDVMDSAFQVELAKLFPILGEIINNVNSQTKPPLAYSKVQAWDDLLSRQLRDEESALSQEHPEHPDTHKIQMDFFRVLVNRTLLALHHHYFSAPRFQQHPKSTATVIRASLEILRIQQTWRGQARTSTAIAIDDPGLSTLPALAHMSETPTHWLLDLCRDDFTAALLYYIVSVRRLSVGAIPRGPIPGPPGQFNVIQQSLEVFRARAGRSKANFDDYATLFLAVGCLQALTAGQPIMTVLLDVAERIEHRIAACIAKQGVLLVE